MKLISKATVASAMAVAMMTSPMALVPASAQDAPATQAPADPAAPAAPAVQVDETKLRSFVVAFLEVDKVGREYRPKFEAAQDPEERQTIQTEAASGMAQAVEQAEGITIEEYNAILRQAQGDPALADKINEIAQETASTQ